MPILFQELTTYDPYNASVNRFWDDRFRYNQLHDKLKKLPTRLQDFIFSASLGDFVKDRLAIPLGLNENQSKEAAVMILELILADIYLGNAVQEIKNRLSIDEMKARSIAGLIVAELFEPILEELKKIHVEKFAKNAPLQSRQQSDDRTVNLRNNS